MAAIVQVPPTMQFQPLTPPSGHAPQTQDPKLGRQKYTRVLYGLGMSELVMGICFMVLGFIKLGIFFSFNDYSLEGISPGIWCSTLLIASGALGIHTKRNSSLCVYNANMTLSIISALMMSYLFMYSVCFAVVHGLIAHAVVFHSLLAIGSFTAMVVCIVHSAYCCAGVCCMKHYYPGQVVYMTPQHPSQQYVQLSNGQYAVIQGPPHANYPHQTIGASPLQESHHPPAYAHPPPTQSMNYPASPSSTGYVYHALAQQDQATDQPGSLPPKFPVTFDQ